MDTTSNTFKIFDTLATAKRLEAKGMPKAQAEEVVEIIKEREA